MKRGELLHSLEALRVEVEKLPPMIRTMFSILFRMLQIKAGKGMRVNKQGARK